MHIKGDAVALCPASVANIAPVLHIQRQTRAGVIVEWAYRQPPHPTAFDGQITAIKAVWVGQAGKVGFLSLVWCVWGSCQRSVLACVWRIGAGVLAILAKTLAGVVVLGLAVVCPCILPVCGRFGGVVGVGGALPLFGVLWAKTGFFVRF